MKSTDNMFNKREYRIYRTGYNNNRHQNYVLTLTSNIFFKKSNRLSLINQLLKVEDRRTRITGLRNVCSLTGAYRAVFNSMLSSRHVYRALGDSSALPNYSKLSW